MEISEVVDRRSKINNIFVRINNDLAQSIKNFDYPINVLYSYVFARKFAAAGLFFARVFF